ncbi:MAG: phosphoglycerate dehydrogenase [Clostridia bacterium]|nr:phosphoglycerate dehydrogenase [Clostridia bacterium]MBQ8963792.1 phosphoglycerate dehydrogenase [Clostridia bacterium]MBQ9039960.1 phosphoglycerate dehydrogenase [Clostridia bacterium]
MYNIQKLNSISPVYHGILPDTEYNVAYEMDNPDAIMVRSAGMHDMAIQENLLCVGRAGAGVNNIPLDKMAEHGVVVFNSPGANANAVKELVLAGLLLASRKIAEGIEWCKGLTPGEQTIEKQVEAGKKQFVGPELAGKTLGVIGLGAIGLQVANAGVALGMDVLGYDPYISVDNAWRLSRSVAHALSLDEVIEKSDYITLHVPLTDGNRGMIDAGAISRMKNTAALLNFARGPLVNVDDVKEALEQGQLRVYVTDFPEAALIGVRNVVLTPHLGASTPESEDNCVRMVARQINDYIKYGSIVNSVNYPNCALEKQTMPRISILHKNVPNVLGAITQVISGERLNIENMVNQSRGAYAYTVLDVDEKPSAQLRTKLLALDTVFRARLLMP